MSDEHPISNRLVVRSQRVLGSGATFEAADVVVEGGVIEAVRPLDDPGSGEARIVDVGDRPVTPAFVNAHTHVVLGFLRGVDLAAYSRGNLVEDFFFPVESALTPGDVRAFARMGAYESLLNGVGLVWDHYYFAEHVADALSDVGLCGVIAPTLQDVAGPGTAQLEEQFAATESIAGSPTRRAAGLFSALGPHATDTVSGELWRRIAKVSEDMGLPIHSHAAQSADEMKRVWERERKTPLQWLRALGVLERSPYTLLVHCLYASRSDLEGVPPTRTAFGFCPYAQRVFGFPADPRVWEECGLPWFVATDTSAGNDSMNLQKELRAVAELRTAPSTYGAAARALRAKDPQAQNPDLVEALSDERNSDFQGSAALADPSRLLDRIWALPGSMHPAFRCGVIEPGALANLLVWDHEHPSFWPAESDRAILQAIAMGDTVGAIHTAIVHGKVQGAVGDFARSILESDAYRAARQEATARLNSEPLARWLRR